MGGNVTEFSMKSAEELLARSYLWKESFQLRHSHAGKLSPER
jgi:hypothetical protein